MTSWSTILNEFIRQHGDDFFNNLEKDESEKWIYRREGEGVYKSWEEFLSKASNYKKSLPEYIMDFMNAVYKIGNFCPVPMGFNTARSGGGSYDYWDLTLMKIRNWYMDNDDEHLNDLLHIKNENRQCRENCKKWLEWFERDAQECYGEEYDGWHNFVDTLHMQDYVNNDYEVIPFWGGHEWDKGTVKVMFPKENEIKNAFKTMTNMICARSKRIAEALTDTEKG